MIRLTKIKYFPVTEIITFSLMIFVSVIVIYFSNSKLFLLVPITPFLYIITMGRATIVRLDDDKLYIKTLSIFLESAQISLHSIIKVQLHQTIEHETDVTFGGSFFAFDKYYEVQYKNEDGEVSKIHFSINNKIKEAKIISIISSFLT